MEGECGTMKQNLFCRNAFSLSRLRRQLPPGGSLIIHLCRRFHLAGGKISSIAKWISSRTAGFHCASSAYRILPQSPSAPAFGPGRKHSLLPALAKNMPPAYFLNASRPPGGSLRMRATLGVWALPEARAFCNAVIQRRNWR